MHQDDFYSFRQRTSEALEDSKKLERQVDQAIKDHFDSQAKLFDLEESEA